ncbi:hypothetical protein roselon_00279 [Roseibacterium elongatum DSM 19469]|uniref:Uncharacterized protein n=1 Tax=Roseicyclus elongatus DSM 19469 TaxID=1294273 RepID=W8RNK3_9RHOB|nr:hypothetical protein [Roseibacterium elongatum]AHM02734.1 hypothetical protein roselon_00279 [Roseibacterium elongatum DSM 19469]
MSVLKTLSMALIALIVLVAATLWIGMRPAEAGVYGTPSGGWGIDRPPSRPAPGPRGGGSAAPSGGAPNV